MEIISNSTTFGYRTDKVKSKPTSVCDVFDLKKIPGKRSLEKKARRELLVPRDTIQPDILDRMTEGPVTDIVQQGGDDKELRLLPADRSSETIIVRKVPEKQQPQAIDT